jgi:hypothetical protein
MLLAMVAIAHGQGLLVNFDDQSFYRATSYLSTSPSDPLLAQLRDHLQSRAHELDPYEYERYRLRLELFGNYMLSNWSVRLLENLPLHSAYQSVFVANLTLHLAAASSAFWALGRFGQLQFSLRMFFLLSLAPSVLFDVFALAGWRGYMRELIFPFHNPIVLWAATVPRGTSLTFFFAALLLWLDAGDTARPGPRRSGPAILLATLSILAHRSMGLLLLGTGLSFWLVRRLVVGDPMVIVQRLRVREFLMLLNGLIAMVAVLKLVLLFAYGSAEIHILVPGSPQTAKGLLRSLVGMTAWIAATNLLVWWWLELRSEERVRSGEALRVGDGFFMVFVAFGALVLGLNVFQPSVSLWYGPLLYATEAGVRLVGVAHIVWWMLLAVCVMTHVAVGRSAVGERGLAASVLAVAVVAALQLSQSARNGAAVAEILNGEKLAIRARELLARPGTEAYRDEARYFHAVANEVRARHVEGRGGSSGR